MSNGPIPPTERCPGSGIKSSPLVLLTAGVTGALVGLLSSYLVGHGELRWEHTSPLSWLLLTFLFLFTFSIFLAIFYLSSNQPVTYEGEEASKYFKLSPAHPNHLQRVRSYLAFFPITHVIQSNNNGGESGGGDSLPNDLDEPGEGLTGRRINIQMDMAIEAIISEYISPWYTKISDDGSFLEQCKTIIHSVFLHLGEKLRQVDRNELAKDAIQILHTHWKEYADALAKSREQGNGDEVHKSFRFVHPFLQDNKEVSQRYQKLVSRVLKELGVPDLSSPVMWQFLAGILVKNFILFYVEMISQPSWVNGSLMTLLSSGSMSVDITGSSSQNSSSPASPLPEPSPKQTHLFGDEVMNDCASICQSLTGGESSSPTKTSCYSQPVSAMSGSGGSQEELSANPSNLEQEEHPAKPQLQRSLESNSSASVDEGTSSEPKTESSARPSPILKGLDEDNKWSSSTSSSSIFPTEVLQPLSRRPRDLKPLKTCGPMRTVTTALGRVMQATAFPLLPSECYYENSSSMTLPDYGNSLGEREELKGSNLLEEFGEENIREEEEEEEEIIMLNTRDSVFERDEDVPIHDDVSGREGSSDNVDEDSVDNKQGNTSPSAALANKTVSSHYYSFDEASKRKLSPSSFFETSTLSLDGAMEGKKQEKDSLQLCSHEYRHGDSSGEGHTPTVNGKPQRSPVYEEPEDFAASIAKLRSLLEQKGGKSCTPPNSACLLEDVDVFESPADSPAAGSGGGSAGTIPQISETCASDTHTTPSSTSSMDISKGSSRFSFNETILIPSESDSTSIEPQDKNYDTVPEIKCCFRNVSIPKVENSADAGGQYIYYCIQYEGVYFDDYDTHPQKLVYRTTTIKRKFKEFLTLQAHLEENIACKPHLKGIKTPTRWLNVSLTKSDATVAHQRRAMLEKYLQQLCYHPVIGFCQEVLIFMAYGEDGFCSFEVGDPKDLLTHRLDKLAKKFTGVINSLKDALPSFELDLTHAPHTPKSEGITPSDLKQESGFPSFSFPEKYSSMDHHDQSGHSILEEPWMEKLGPGWTTDNINPDSNNDDDGDDKMMRDHPHVDTELANGSSSPTQPSSSEVDGTEPGKIFSVYPLAAAVTHLLCDVLWLPQYRPHPTSITTFMSISGKSLENYVMETMDIFLSEEAILGYLEWLTISINTGQSDTDSQRCDVSSDLFSEQDLKNIVKRRIPAWVRWMWGRNRLDLTIDRLTGLFQSPLVNHDLVLSLSELLFSKMVNLVDELEPE